MKFKFSLQKLLDVRKAEVEVVQKDFLEAKARENIQRTLNAKMIEELNTALSTKSDLQNQGGKVSSSIIVTQTFIEGQKLKIAKQEKIIEGLLQISEEKRLVLLEKMKNVKTLEKLKERRFNEFKALLKKKELKELDEIVTNSFGRRGF